MLILIWLVRFTIKFIRWLTINTYPSASLLERIRGQYSFCLESNRICRWFRAYEKRIYINILKVFKCSSNKRKKKYISRWSADGYRLSAAYRVKYSFFLELMDLRSDIFIYWFLSKPMVISNHSQSCDHVDNAFYVHPNEI